MIGEGFNPDLQHYKGYARRGTKKDLKSFIFLSAIFLS